MNFENLPPTIAAKHSLVQWLERLTQASKGGRRDYLRKVQHFAKKHNIDHPDKYNLSFETLVDSCSKKHETWRQFLKAIQPSIPKEIQSVLLEEHPEYVEPVVAGQRTKPMNPSSNTPPIDTLIMSALSEELIWVERSSHFTNSETSNLTKSIPSKTGNIGSSKVVVASMDEMGLTHTAIATTLLLQTYKPKRAFLIGICGGVEGNANLCDIVVPSMVMHFFAGSFDQGILRPETKTVEPNTHLTKSIQTYIESNLHHLTHNVSPNTPTGRAIKIHKKTMGTSDLVVKDQALINTLSQRDRKLQSIDMESYAFLKAIQIVSENLTEGAIVKSVSDLANNKKDDNYREYCIKLVSECVCSYIKKYPAA